MVNLTPVRLAYCAGLIDGEAYVGAIRRMPSAANKLKAPKYTIRVCISMADESPVRYLAETVDATDKVYIRDRRAKAHHSAMYVLDLENNAAERLLRLTLPYLLCKKRQAERAIALFEFLATSKENRNTPNADRTALQRDRVFLKRCDRFYLAMKRRVVSNNGVATRPL